MSDKTVTTDLPIEFLEKVEKFKKDKLLDIIRRTIANPGNAEHVAEALAKDWHPLFQVGSDKELKLAEFT
jgi:hypothetical protein